MPRPYRLISFALTAAALGMWIGCGGAEKPPVSSTSSPPTTVQPEDKPAPAEATGEEKFRAQQFQTCDAMCESLTGCAVASAKASWDQLSAEEREAVEDEKVLAENSRQCATGCQDASLSPRQVRVVRECLAPMPADGALPTGPQCGAFIGCLESAQKQE